MMTDEQGRYTPTETPVGAQLINMRTQLTRLRVLRAYVREHGNG